MASASPPFSGQRGCRPPDRTPGIPPPAGPDGTGDAAGEPVEEALARAAPDSVLDGRILGRYLEEPRGDLAAGIFDTEIQEWIGAESRLVLLREEIMRKQKGLWSKRRPDGELRYRGHDLGASQYRLLPRLIAEPQLVLRFMPVYRISKEKLALRLNLISEVDGTFYNTVIGRFPDDPTKVGIISFHEIEGGRAHVDRMIARAETGLAGEAVFRNSLRQRE